MACGLPIGVQRYVDYEATIRPPDDEMNLSRDMIKCHPALHFMRLFHYTITTRTANQFLTLHIVDNANARRQGVPLSRKDRPSITCIRGFPRTLRGTKGIGGALLYIEYRLIDVILIMF